MIDTNKQILAAAHQFKKAIEQMGNKDVVIIYSYRGKNVIGQERIFTKDIADSFLQTVGVCDLVKFDILNPNSNSN
jgi:hypothetical protein